MFKTNSWTNSNSLATITSDNAFFSWAHKTKGDQTYTIKFPSTQKLPFTAAIFSDWLQTKIVQDATQQATLVCWHYSKTIYNFKKWFVDNFRQNPWKNTSSSSADKLWVKTTVLQNVSESSVTCFTKLPMNQCGIFQTAVLGAFHQLFQSFVPPTTVNMSAVIFASGKMDIWTMSS